MNNEKFLGIIEKVIVFLGILSFSSIVIMIASGMFLLFGKIIFDVL